MSALRAMTSRPAMAKVKIFAREEWSPAFSGSMVFNCSSGGTTRVPLYAIMSTVSGRMRDLLAGPLIVATNRGPASRLGEVCDDLIGRRGPWTPGMDR